MVVAAVSISILVVGVVGAAAAASDTTFTTTRSTATRSTATSSSSSNNRRRHVTENDTDEKYYVPSFTVQELQTLFSRDDGSNNNNNAQQRFIDTITTTGLFAIQIDDDDDSTTAPANNEYQYSRSTALNGLCSCAGYGQSSVTADDSTNDNDNTNDEVLFRTIYSNEHNPISRTTYATATVANNVPLSLPLTQLTQACGFDVVHAMESLRDYISDATTTFVSTIDNYIFYTQQQQIRSPLLRTSTGQTYSTIQSVLAASTHLEHFHVYRKLNVSSTSSSDEKEQDKKRHHGTKSNDNLILDVHTDAGLFLTFTPGFNCQQPSSSSSSSSYWEDSGLYVQVPTTAITGTDNKPILKRAIFPTNSIGILFGIGMQNWISPTSSSSTSTSSSSSTTTSSKNPVSSTFTGFQATSHAVYLPIGTQRAWYGRMHLVPPEAIIQEYPQQRTFADMRQAMVVSGTHSLKHHQKHQQHHNTAGQHKNHHHHQQPNSHVSSMLGVSIGCGIDEEYQAQYEQQVQDEEDEQKQHVPDLGDDGIISSSHTVHRRRRLNMVDDASFCNNSTNFYCWMSCLKVPDSANASKYLDDGYSLYCADPTILIEKKQPVADATKVCNEYTRDNTVIIGGAMNTACIGIWTITADNVPPTPIIPPTTNNKNTSSNTSNSSSNSLHPHDDTLPFCYGGTSMYMDGFHWMNPVCVIYLFPNWVLSSIGQFIAACIGTVIAAISLEGFIHKRRTIVTDLPIGWIRLSVSTICYGIQLTIGYLIMLIVMTFSAPLFLSVVIGLMSGHFLCNMNDVINDKKKNNEEEEEQQQQQQHDKDTDYAENVEYNGYDDGSGGTSTNGLNNVISTKETSTSSSSSSAAATTFVGRNRGEMEQFKYEQNQSRQVQQQQQHHQLPSPPSCCHSYNDNNKNDDDDDVDGNVGMTDHDEESNVIVPNCYSSIADESNYLSTSASTRTSRLSGHARPLATSTIVNVKVIKDAASSRGGGSISSRNIATATTPLQQGRQQPAATPNSSSSKSQRKKTKPKNIVPEGCTPCCQNAL